MAAPAVPGDAADLYAAVRALDALVRETLSALAWAWTRRRCER